MANMYNINGLSYNAQENPEWFTRAMFGGRLVQGGYIRVLTGIKGDELLSMIDLDNKILQIDGKDCAWTPNQIIKLSDKKAKVKTYKINLEQCIDELENKRTLYMLSPGAKNESLPPELEEATLQLIAIGLSNEIEEMIIGGDESVDPNQFNGMEKTLLDSTQAAKLVGAVITKANVLQTFEDVYNAVSEDVLQSEDAGTLYIFGSYSTRRILRAALADKNNQVLAEAWTVDDTDKRNPRIYYLGVEFVPVKGIGKNTLICIDGTNAFLLTDLLSDLDEIEMGQFPKPNDSKVWIKGRMRLGFVIPFEDEAVIWSDKVKTAQEAGPGNNDLAITPNSLVFSAAGEAKTFTVVTKKGVTPEVNTVVDGFTVKAGETSEANGVNVTTVTVTAADNSSGINPRVGQVRVNLPDSDRGAVVTLNQRTEDIDTVFP
ncbi:hypothetical protein [Bacteroides nordii]|uniref:Major capsid protein n=2 Tax=Bacteroides nordii TaxID=291645 RepID=I8X9L5_9BACE|nr:hypothetical protein [Bacteroides nordii]EIY47550.1 hypothetical protein HMPREF1068_03200 [Bacteroides nordii CL02T12C05]MCG4768906.1 hypothetical protein [Bacteroides nordii]